MWWMLAVAQAGGGWSPFPADRIVAVQGPGRPDVVAIGSLAVEAANNLPQVGTVHEARGKESRRPDEQVLRRAEVQQGWVLRPVEGLPDTVIATFHGDAPEPVRVMLMTGGRVVASKGQHCPPPPAPSVAPRVDAAREDRAASVLKEAYRLTNDEHDTPRALEMLTELQRDYPDTRAGRAGQRLHSELAIVGEPAFFEVDHWVQGEVDLSDHRVTLLVFWEAWCPHCKREVPKLQQLHDRFEGRLGLVGLTKMTRDITEDDVVAFLGREGVSYPIAKERGMSMSQHYGVRGVPAAAVVRDGVVIWRGHPARITDETVEAWLAE